MKRLSDITIAKRPSYYQVLMKIGFDTVVLGSGLTKELALEQAEKLLRAAVDRIEAMEES